MATKESTQKPMPYTSSHGIPLRSQDPSAVLVLRLPA
jgi:hypothetical protein